MISLNKALSMIKSKEIEFVDLKFCDLRGTWQHMTLSAHEFTKETCETGVGFDGSSIKGFQSIYDSDMLLMPDVRTIFKDPFFGKTFSCICSIYDPQSVLPSPKDPRHTAQKAEKYLKKTNVGDVSYWGPELEFFVFDQLSIDLGPYKQAINICNREIPGEDHSSSLSQDGYKIPVKRGYFPVPPFDKLQEFRSEMVSMLESLGVVIEVHHHEVATAGQVEIDLRYDGLVSMADKVMLYKYVARNLAKSYGMVAVFLPKPIFGDNGSGMHTHQSIFKKNKNMFYDPKGYGEISKIGLSYVAGLLKHVSAILGITNPTTNSYRRLVPHFEAPTSIAFSARNRSAAVRIPMYFSKSEKSKRLEFRCPDPTCNPYLSFAAQLVAGIDGVKNKLDPIKLGFGPFDDNIWERKDVAQTPKSLFETLAQLEKDDIFTMSGVFSKELIKSYLEMKSEEATEVMMYPTPADFFYYGDI